MQHQHNVSRESFRRWQNDNFYFLVRALLPRGKLKGGRQWEALNPVRADGKPGSFLVCVSGAKLGVWKDFATGDGGIGIVSLMAYLAGQDYKSKEVRKQFYKKILQEFFS